MFSAQAASALILKYRSGHGPEPTSWQPGNFVRGIVSVMGPSLLPRAFRLSLARDFLLGRTNVSAAPARRRLATVIAGLQPNPG